MHHSVENYISGPVRRQELPHTTHKTNKKYLWRGVFVRNGCFCECKVLFLRKKKGDSKCLLRYKNQSEMWQEVLAIQTEGHHMTCSSHSSLSIPLLCRAPACKFVSLPVSTSRARPFWWLRCGTHTIATLKWSQSQLFHDGQGQGYIINTNFQGNHSNLLTLTF